MDRSDGQFGDDDLLPLSALQHMVFCDRQAALIHLERVWLDNALTVEGVDLHRVADALNAEDRGDVLIRRGLHIHSHRLGLVGKADLVEFRRVADGDEAGAKLDGLSGTWHAAPVEYKRGRPKRSKADEVQLCAQGMCLEEMFGVRVTTGSIFYGQTRRREWVTFAPELRTTTETTAADFRHLIEQEMTPIRPWEPKCRRCSLLPACLPPRRSRPKSVRKYLQDILDSHADL